MVAAPVSEEHEFGETPAPPGGEQPAYQPTYQPTYQPDDTEPGEEEEEPPSPPPVAAPSPPPPVDDGITTVSVSATAASALP